MRRAGGTDFVCAARSSLHCAQRSPQGHDGFGRDWDHTKLRITFPGKEKDKRKARGQPQRPFLIQSNCYHPADDEFRMLMLRGGISVRVCRACS